MKSCTTCGHELGDGRFCMSCGTPVARDLAEGPPVLDDGRTDTAERPAVRHVASAPAPTTPPAQRADDYSGRYPLFADDPPAGSETAVHPAFHSSENDVVPWSPHEPRERRVWPVFVGVGVVLAVIVGLGIWLLGGQEQPSANPLDQTSSGRTTAGKPSPSGKPSNQPSSKSTGPVKAPSNPADLARTATAKAPVTAPPNEDVRGNLVRYTAANMLDGIASTAWRMPGDGTGTTLTFTLPHESVLTDVGLINGYAKIDRAAKGRPVDWYTRNRKVTKVEWAFDDGTTVTQSLDLTSRLQRISMPPVRTTTVRLTLLAVSAPGKRDGRNYTPVSDVALIGG